MKVIVNKASFNKSDDKESEVCLSGKKNLYYKCPYSVGSDERLSDQKSLSVHNYHCTTNISKLKKPFCIKQNGL